jgi:exopolyphosphatase / guanosine-5'-triphosphate,3'-diphosphate pyrophosphatase
MKVVRAAGVDIGTNSVRLLIADVSLHEKAVALETIHRLMTITRLGEGVDKSNRLGDEPIARTLAVLRDYKKLMGEQGVEARRVAATSATRQAANASQFLEPVRKIMEAEPEVLSGQEEASFSFLGATYELGELWPDRGKVLVVDIGGGSTEIITGTREELLMNASIDVGCVRMSERFIRSDPPSRHELDEMEDYIKNAMGETAPRAKSFAPDLMIGLAGTITTLSGLKLGLDSYRGELINHSWLSRHDVEELYDRLSLLKLEERRAFMRLEPGRADIILGGCGVLRVLLRELGIERFLVSEKDILDGLVITAVSHEHED